MTEEALKAPKRKKPNYFTQILSISLVLFMIGVLAAFVIQAKKLTDYVKESILIQVELNKDLDDASIARLKNSLEAKTYVNKVEYISKERALKILKDKTGDINEDLLDENPLYNSFNISLKANYTNTDSLKMAKADILKNSEVREVYYQEQIAENIDKNIKRVSFIVLGIAAIMFLISLVIIDSTIRLSMFSNRFTIRSMQLVGATRWFIVKPYMVRAVLIGFFSGVIASVGILLLFIFIEKELKGLTILNDLVTFATIIGGTILLGMVISAISTRFAVAKYLKLKLDELY